MNETTRTTAMERAEHLLDVSFAYLRKIQVYENDTGPKRNQSRTRLREIAEAMLNADEEQLRTLEATLVECGQFLKNTDHNEREYREAKRVYPTLRDSCDKAQNEFVRIFIREQGW